MPLGKAMMSAAKKPVKKPMQSAAGSMAGGIGPSINAMGAMMGKAQPPGQMQMPGNRFGQAANQAIGGQGLGGFQQQRALRQKQNFMPRQDMGQAPQIGMSSDVLPGYGGPQMEPPQMQQLPAPPMQQQQPQMNPWEQAQQQALASYGPKSSLRRGGIGPRFM